MESLSLCRICLATDVQLCPIAGHLEVMYETITAMKFKTEDRRPQVACYICHARLQNCYRMRTGCLRSEELLTEMMSSGEIQLQDVLSTNTFGVVSVLQLSLGHELQDTTECHVKEVIHDDGLDELNSEDPEDIKLDLEDTIVQVNEPSGDGPSSQSADSVCVEVNDPKTDAENIKLEIEDTVLEEHGAGPSLQSVYSLCVNDPKTNEPVLKKAAVNNPYTVTELETENVVFVARNVHKTYSRTGAKLNIHEDNKAMAPHAVDKQTPKHKISSINECFTITACTEHCMFDEREFQCDVCNKCFDSNKLLRQHMYTHPDKIEQKQFQCDLCIKSFECELYLRKHMFAHRDNKKKKEFYCDMCDKCFISKPSLTKHIYTHTGEKPFHCNVCNKWFRQKSHLTSHMYTHTGESPFNCDICDKNFRRKISLKLHMYTHTGEMPFHCDICNKSFRRKKSLIQHIYKHNKKQFQHKNKQNEKRFQCNFCLKYFKRKQHLTLHTHTHTGEKPFHCDVCNKFFSLNYKVRHMNIHTGEKRYKCDVCNKCFNAKQILTKHMKTHTREKQFQCDVCNKYFLHKHNLARHMNIHAGKKRFSCDVCNKTFARNYNLTRHMYTHTHKSNCAYTDDVYSSSTLRSKKKHSVLT